MGILDDFRVGGAVTEALLQEHAILSGKAKFGELDDGEKARIAALKLAIARRVTMSPRVEDVDRLVKLAADRVRGRVAEDTCERLMPGFMLAYERQTMPWYKWSWRWVVRQWRRAIRRWRDR